MVVLRVLMVLLLSFGALSARAQVTEPKVAKSVKALKPGEGILRLSLRSQRQFIDTAYLYLVRVNPDGSDGPQVLRFERGAGVPLAGSNMIDVKPRYYRVPAGSYRLFAYTVACPMIPDPGTTCMFYGRPLPTGAYASGSPTLEVREGALTDGGDFVIEYIKAVDLDTVSLFDDNYSNEVYDVRWKPIRDALLPEFAALPTGPAIQVPAGFKSRIECEQRPKTYKIQFSFRCPASAPAR
ncbi:MAG: hypothetical protein ABW182_08620 [Sphingomonas sp.]